MPDNIGQIGRSNLGYYESFARNNLFVVLGNILIYARGIILLPILIKNIGAGSYGGYVLLMTTLGFISAVSTLGVGFNFQRFIPSVTTAEGRRNLFYPQLIFQFISISVISLILIGSQNFIKSSLLKGKIDFSIYIVILILFIYILYSSSTDYFKYTHRLKNFSLAVTMQSYLMVLFMALVIFYLRRAELNFLLIAYLSSMVFVAIPILWRIYKEIGVFPFSLKISNIFQDIRTGFPLVLSYFVDFILSSGDKYVIAFLMSPQAVGFYTPAYALGSLIILVPKACAGGALPPLLANAADNNKANEFKTLIDYAIKLFLLLAIPYVFGSFVLSKSLLELFANKEVAGAAHLAMPIVALGIMFYGINLIFFQILFIKFKTRVIFGINAISAIINLLLNLIFISIFKNILVAAITTLVSYFASFLLLHSKVRDYIKVNYNFGFLLKCVFASLVMAISLHLYVQANMANNLLNIGLSIMFAGSLYFLSLFILGALTAKEIKFFRSLLFKR